MALEVENIINRGQFRRSRNVWRVLAVLSILVVLIMMFVRINGPGSGVFIAVVEVDNIIVDDPDRDRMLRDIIQTPEAQALIVSINSPGGTVVGGEALYRALRSISKKIPVVAIMREVATSAGYMVALGADHIVARQATITGSIGVLMQSADITEFLKKVGIKPEAVKSSPLKAQPNPLEPFSQEARLETKKVVSDIHRMFVELLIERRNLIKKKAENLSNGRIFTGRQALENGLIDELGGETAARNWLMRAKGIGKDAPLKKLTVERMGSDWASLLRDIFSKTAFYDRLRLDGLISLWHPRF